MSLIREILKQIEVNQSKEFNSIPIPENFSRFAPYLPGIQHKRYYAVTGAPGSGKTQFTDNLFLCHAVNFALDHGIDIEVVYFSFEISTQEKLTNLLSKRIFEAYGTKIPPQVLHKVGHSKPLTENQKSKLEKVTPYFDRLLSKVTFYEERMTPSQIYKIQMEKINQNGKIDNKGDYIPYNPDKYLIFITDHVSLITPETGQTLHQALTTFSGNNIYLKNKYGVTIINIHQQNVDSQVQQFTNKGDSIASKVEPRLENLADNRTLGRDYDLVLGLFSPAHYEIDFHRGYKTGKFGDRCRFLSICKNRHGEQGYPLALYFDGAVGYFEEYPKSEEFLMIKNGQKVENTELYERYENGLVGIMNPIKQRSFTF